MSDKEFFDVGQEVHVDLSGMVLRSVPVGPDPKQGTIVGVDKPRRAFAVRLLHPLGRATDHGVVQVSARRLLA
jgi:hypothetical protein